MPSRSFAACWLVSPLLALAGAGDSRAADNPTAAGVEFFESKIRPVLVKHCYHCHSAKAKKLKGGLRLDSRAGLLQGGDSGPALVPSRPERSRLIEAVGYKNVDLQMPPRAKLPDRVIADLTAWVKMDTPWPRENPSHVSAKAKFDLAKRKREHWAWQPVRPQDPPAVRNSDWPRSPVDAFILAKLESKGLVPAAPADRRMLLRRVYFDLIGMPPTAAEVEAFLRDRSAGAWERVVDRLLASPHFGERWGRHWLDLVRYAESRGHELDYTSPNAYQYRDYVLRAVNADVPYSQFVKEQIAGDLLPRPRLHPVEGFDESLVGTGFWFLGEEVHSPVDIRQDHADRLDNQIDVFGKAFLGLTLACARCHDHKFDAISTRDYYALSGFLQGGSYRLARFDSLRPNRRVAYDLAALRDEYRPRLQRVLARGMRPVAQRLAEYLSAARDALHSGLGTPAQRPRLAALARADHLDETMLAAWVAHLAAVARDGNDPLHLVARAAAEDLHDSRQLAELTRKTVGERRQKAAAGATARKTAGVVIDYARVKPEHWIQDGFTFGTNPVRPGDVRVGADGSVRFIDYAAAEQDPVWQGLTLATGAEKDPGTLGAVVRSGRTIRTPTFPITAGKVYYLVKGTGQAFAAVGAHVMIAGPLHGRLVVPLRAGPAFKWVCHDLTAYKGQRAHVEFTATRSDFAVAMVVQAASTPPPPDRPNRVLTDALAASRTESFKSLSQAYQHLFTDLACRLAEDRITAGPAGADWAALADWVVRHPLLFGLSEQAGGKELAAQAKAFVGRRAKLARCIRKESRLALAMLDGTGLDEHVFVRGSPKVLGEVVPRRFLEALAGPDRMPVARGSGRLELAMVLTDPARNPFLARVMVNRIWHHLFGRGIVPSVDNFGVLGEPPTHPEFLDYLAERFVKQGWSVKQMIRMLVLSTTYRMASRADDRADAADPRNVLLHRMPLRRLEGEAIRDAMLALSGRLDRALYGPAVPVYLTPFLDGRGRPASGPLDGAGRRSVYLAVRRNFLSPFLVAFDTPIPFSTMGRRTVSNVPAQALILMNDPFAHQQAALWAGRVLARPGTARGRIVGMYQAAFARPPTQTELAACLDFVCRQSRGGAAAWVDLAHVLFNAKEFIFLH
jgi:hypothetical protein